jgi:hypothetical protein
MNQSSRSFQVEDPSRKLKTPRNLRPYDQPVVDLGSTKRHPGNGRSKRPAAADARYDRSPLPQQTFCTSLAIARQRKHVVAKLASDKF